MESKKSIAYFLLLLSVILLYGFVSGAVKRIPCDRNTNKEVDRILSQINPIGDPSVNFPESYKEVLEDCARTKNSISQLEDVNRRCMKDLIKQVVSLIIFSVRKEQKVICKKSPTPSKDVSDLIASGKCINKARPQLESCANETMDRLLNIKFAEEKIRIPLLCCEIPKLKQCLLSAMSRVDICTDKHQETLLKHARVVTGNALQLACSEYREGSAKCDSLKLPNVQKRKGQKRPKSFIVPIINLLKSFPEI